MSTQVLHSVKSLSIGTRRRLLANIFKLAGFFGKLCSAYASPILPTLSESKESQYDNDAALCPLVLFAGLFSLANLLTNSRSLVKD